MNRKVNANDFKETTESQHLEFKKSLSLRKDALEALNAMVNSDAAKGCVVFGIDPQGAVVGIEPGNLDSAQQSLSQHIREKFEPALVHTIEILDCEGKVLLTIQAERSKNTPYHEYDGRAFIREGSSNRQLSLQEKKGFTKRRDRDQHNGPWKCDGCGSVVGMLMNMNVSDQGVTKSYYCDCGGSYWPI